MHVPGKVTSKRNQGSRWVPELRTIIKVIYVKRCVQSSVKIVVKCLF